MKAAWRRFRGLAIGMQAAALVLMAVLALNSLATLSVIFDVT